jgi:hypothetical protein
MGTERELSGSVVGAGETIVVTWAAILRTALPGELLTLVSRGLSRRLTRLLLLSRSLGHLVPLTVALIKVCHEL